MTILHLDFETRSCTDLRKAGLDNYCADPTTEPWCLAYAIDDGEPAIWTRDETWDFDSAFAPEFYDAWDGDGLIVAHNAGFELDIWNRIMVPRFGWPVMDIGRVHCTMAMAYAMALPGDLDRAAPALGLTIRKDELGHRIMRLLAAPAGTRNGYPVWYEDPEKIAKLYEYCRQDVRVEQALHKRLMHLSDQEQALWRLDYKINRRGVMVDRQVVERSVAIAKSERTRFNDEIKRVTKGCIYSANQNAAMADWVRRRGVDIEGVAKDDVADALALPDLPDDVREALTLRRAAGKSSTAKLTPMLDAGSADGRLRGMFQFHGAATGRWAGRKVQLQNLPRPTMKWARVFEMVDVLRKLPPDQALLHLDIFYANPLDCISQSLRSMLMAAPGHTLFVADYSNIEGRGIAWQAGEEWKLDAFRAYDNKTGPDIYLLTASGILKVPVETLNKESPERQSHGKVPELACGYGGGVGAFQQMAKTYLVKIENALAESIKNGWREKHPRIVQYWYDLEQAAKSAILNPGQPFAAGAEGRQSEYLVEGSFLWCMLPSGRPLCYPYPCIKPKMTPWGEMRDQVHYWHLNGITNKWEETHTYGGKLSENTTQAICRDVLAEAMLRVDDEFPIVMHVHDEIVSEMPRGSNRVPEFERLVAQPPAWADGFPIAVEGWQGERYRK